MMTVLAIQEVNQDAYVQPMAQPIDQCFTIFLTCSTVLKCDYSCLDRWLAFNHHLAVWLTDFLQHCISHWLCNHWSVFNKPCVIESASGRPWPNHWRFIEHERGNHHNRPTSDIILAINKPWAADEPWAIHVATPSTSAPSLNAK